MRYWVASSLALLLFEDSGKANEPHNRFLPREEARCGDKGPLSRPLKLFHDAIAEAWASAWNLALSTCC